MIKRLLMKWLHCYQSDFNEDKYWKRRLYLQSRGGNFQVLYDLL